MKVVLHAHSFYSSPGLSRCLIVLYSASLLEFVLFPRYHPEHGRFEDVPPEPENRDDRLAFCVCCEALELEERRRTPTPLNRLEGDSSKHQVS